MSSYLYKPDTQPVASYLVNVNIKRPKKMTEKEILSSCFKSSSQLWNSFLAEEGEINTLYYPSAGEDMRPFVFSKKENLEFMGLNTDEEIYVEPDLFIFSDYFPFSNSRFFDSRYLHWDNYTCLYIENYCELTPTINYNYVFNDSYVDFKPSQATGKAIFFKVKVDSHRVSNSYFKYGIYFFYENVNLIEQLFLKNKLPFSHLVWKRDGSGLGGGRVKLDFIFHVSARCETEYFFIWDRYLNEDGYLITQDSYGLERAPIGIKKTVSDDLFEISLTKKLNLKWELHDKMNMYFKSQT